MSAQFVSQTVRTATGHWPVILPALGIALQPNGKPQPCPTCGGKDRFRFDNQGGRGTWFCNQCGAGDGLNLVEKALSLSARAAAEQVAAVMGRTPAPCHRPLRPAMHHRRPAGKTRPRPSARPRDRHRLWWLLPGPRPATPT